MKWGPNEHLLANIIFFICYTLIAICVIGWAEWVRFTH